jgi:hypothetical protein
MDPKRWLLSWSGHDWVTHEGDEVIARFDDKIDAEKQATRIARESGETINLRIEGRDGTFQHEHRYPRGRGRRSLKRDGG